MHHSHSQSSMNFFAYEKNNILIISQHKQRKIKEKARYMFLEFCTLTSLSHPYVYTSFLFLWNFCLISFRADGNKAYLLQIGSEKVPVYCHMTSLGECGGYGWTLVMKMNGSLVCTQVLYGSQVLREMSSENSELLLRFPIARTKLLLAFQDSFASFI